MTIFAELLFDSAATGTSQTPSNSGASPQGQTGGNAATFDTAAAAHGPTGGRWERAAGGNAAGSFSRLTFGTPTTAIQFDGVWTGAASPTATRAILNLRHASGRLLSLAHNATLGLYVLDRANTGNFILPSASITAGKRYRITIWGVARTGTSSEYHARVYDFDTGQTIGTARDITNADLGNTQPFAAADFGTINDVNGVSQWDTLRFGDAASELTPFIAPIEGPPAVPPAAAAAYEVGVLGDSKAFQAGTGATEIRAAFAARGWTPEDVKVSGVTSRVPWGGTVTPTTEASLNEWKVAGFRPTFTVLILGGNIRNSQPSTWQFQMTSLMTKLRNDYGQFRYSDRYLLLNLAYEDPNDGLAFNNWLAQFASESAVGVHIIDQWSMIRAREQSGQPVSWNSDGVHMQPGPTGYGLINDLIVDAVAKVSISNHETSQPVSQNVVPAGFHRGDPVNSVLWGQQRPLQLPYVQQPVLNPYGIG